MLSRKQLIALASIAALSAGASEAKASAIPSPLPSAINPLRAAEIEKLIQQFRDAIASGKTLSLDLQKEFLDYEFWLTEMTLSRTDPLVSPPPSPRPDPRRIFRDMQKLTSKQDEYFNALRDIINKYNETCKGAIRNIQ